MNSSLFFTVFVAGKFRIKAPADSVSSEVPVPGSEMAVFSLCPHMMAGMRDLSGVSSTRALIPFMRAQPSSLITSQRPHPHIPPL